MGVDAALTVGRDVHLEALLVQVGLEDARAVRIVFDDEHASGHLELLDQILKKGQ
jgi:DUF971 family protein